MLIDSWGFTLRVAQRLRRLDPDLPLIKYVGPQVWATRPGRAKTLAAAVDHLLSIHAFDAPYFEAAGPAGHLRRQLGAERWTSRTADPARLRDADRRRRRTTRSCWSCRAAGRARSTASCRPFEDAVHRLKAERPGPACGGPRRADRGGAGAGRGSPAGRTAPMSSRARRASSTP